MTQTDFEFDEIEIYEGKSAEYFALKQAKGKKDLVPYLHKFISEHEKELMMA
ncbi:MAG: hypothetical protein U9O20_01550 [Patescibacteria group bacterium]|nr:hypothetical protein [Patescibacteria group bacterium]